MLLGIQIDKITDQHHFAVFWAQTVKGTEHLMQRQCARRGLCGWNMLLRFNACR
ncbi:Uncharacterised protein [Vibrio cholerae]|nr:Uncharacterised protein [Vibrio cholerae]